MAEGGRNSRLPSSPSGYAEDFVNTVEEDFRCSICLLPLKEPVQTRCGHRFCKECLEEHFRRQGDIGQLCNCPTDRVDLDQARDVFPDKATERKILSFAIKCPTESCSWIGELGNKQDHLGQCIKSLLCCPNKCGRSIPREKIPDHTTNDCPLSLIPCPYEQIGCKRKVQRRDVESHLQSAMKPHLDLACVKLETRMFIWKIKCFSKLLRQAKAGEKLNTASAPFYSDRSESYGYKLKVRIDPNGKGTGKNTHLSVFIVVMKGEYDAILPWPFKKKVKFTLIDQQEDSVEQENITLQFIPGNYPECFARPMSKENSVGHGYPQFISHEVLHSRRYIVNDTLFLKVEVGSSSR